ncbi:MAG: hypothetical protein H3C45_05565 [Bacteroidia bacterium]|nr:hypothetical protein [Bacteroidia bacterium]
MIKHVLFLASILTFAACNKTDELPENPKEHNEQEMITTIQLIGGVMDNSNDTLHHFTATWSDPDGAGGNLPTIDTLVLDTGVFYWVNVVLLNTTKNPIDTISNEVYEERNVHQFFYTLSENLENKVKLNILDFDNNTPPLPVGLSITLNTKTNTTYSLPILGSLRVQLSHYDGVPKTNAPSNETDLDVVFPVKLRDR